MSCSHSTLQVMTPAGRIFQNGPSSQGLVSTEVPNVAWQTGNVGWPANLVEIGKILSHDFSEPKDSTEIEIYTKNKGFFTLNHHEIGEVSSWLTTTWPASLDMTSSGTRTSNVSLQCRWESFRNDGFLPPNKLPANQKSNGQMSNTCQTHDNLYDNGQA